MLRTRALQKETGGFTEFVPLPYVHMAAPLYLQGKSRQGPTFRESMLMHAVARIVYAGTVDNIQVSWVKLGAHGAGQLLAAGANDLGGTLMDENISRAAGASHGQMMDEAGFGEIVDTANSIDAGTRRLVQRTTLYGRLTPA
jgi:FO synthase